MSRPVPSAGFPLPYRYWHIEQSEDREFYDVRIPHFRTHGEALAAAAELARSLVEDREEGEPFPTVPSVAHADEPCVTLTCRCGQYGADSSGEGTTHFDDPAMIDEHLWDFNLERDADGFITCESAKAAFPSSHCPHQSWHLEPGVFNKNRWVCDSCPEVLVLGPGEAPVSP